MIGHGHLCAYIRRKVEGKVTGRRFDRTVDPWRGTVSLGEQAVVQFIVRTSRLSKDGKVAE
jgi:hypothetical protein